jgi:hypothetical protein
MGVPYFRGLATGLISANHLARLLSSKKLTYEAFSQEYKKQVDHLFETRNYDASKDAKNSNLVGSIAGGFRSSYACALDASEGILGDRAWRALQRPFMRF